MTEHDHIEGASSPGGGFWKSRTGLVLIAFLTIGAVLLVFEHRAHIPGSYWLLGGLLALCVLMHRFMHGGHGDHGGGHSHDGSPNGKKD